jgi:Universal stress protein UspA and related nucleotide-binding proteins
MELYQHLLVGLDLSKDSAKVLTKAARIAAGSGAKLTVAHITEPLAFAYGGDVPIDLSEAQGMIEHQAKKRLTALVEELDVDADIVVSIGDTASELHHLAESRAADLLVVGSHGRHGFAMLFGSVTKGVVSGASCDVLAVRV